jgi:hypothetical protein
MTAPLSAARAGEPLPGVPSSREAVASAFPMPGPPSAPLAEEIPGHDR